MVEVICDMKECVYYVHKPEKGEAYQNQCENDEIEISHSELSLDIPQCFTFDKAK